MHRVNWGPGPTVPLRVSQFREDHGTVSDDEKISQMVLAPPLSFLMGHPLSVTQALEKGFTAKSHVNIQSESLFSPA